MKLPATRSVSGTIVKAASLFSGVKALSLLCSLVRNKLIAWLIGPAGLGLVILYNSALDMIGTLTRLSIDQSATRDVAQNTSPEHAGIISLVVRRWSLWLGIAGMILVCALSPLLSDWMFGNTDKWHLFCMLSPVPLAISVATGRTSIMTGQNRFGALSKASVFSSLSAIIISVVLIWWLRINSIVPVILVYALALLAGAMIYSPKFPKIKLSFSETYRRGLGFIRLGILMTASTFIAQLFAYLFVLYLNKEASTSTVGLFQGGYTLVNTYVGVIFTGIWVEYFPRLSRATHSQRNTMAVVSHEIVMSLCMLTPIVLIFIAADRFIIELIYAPDFISSLPYVSIAMIGVILRAYSWCVAFVIVARGDGKIYIASETASAIIGFALNIAGWHIAGMAGLGMAFVLWYAVYSVMVTFIYRYRYGLRIPAKLITVTCAIVLLATGALWLKTAAGFWIPLLLGIVATPVCLRVMLKK